MIQIQYLFERLRDDKTHSWCLQTADSRETEDRPKTSALMLKACRGVEKNTAEALKKQRWVTW